MCGDPPPIPPTKYLSLWFNVILTYLWCYVQVLGNAELNQALRHTASHSWTCLLLYPHLLNLFSNFNKFKTQLSIFVFLTIYDDEYKLSNWGEKVKWHGYGFIGGNSLQRIVRRRSRITKVFLSDFVTRASSIANSPRLVATKRHFLLRLDTSGLAYIQEEEPRLQKVRRVSSVLSVQGDAGNLHHL